LVKIKTFIPFLFVCLSLSCLKAQVAFQDITTKAGIEHYFEVYEGMFGGGACVIDINQDGFEDIYLTGGMRDDALYLNNKNGSFRNIFEGSGLEITRGYVTQGVCRADINKDGWPDLFITTITRRDSILTIPRAQNLLFLNKKNNRFEEVSISWGLDQLISFSTGASFGDINGDGYPDLYVGNYFHEFQGVLKVINDETIVNAHRTAKGYLLINKKGRGFSDQYDKYGFNHRGFGFGAIFTDLDTDGDLDLIINHDFGYKATPNVVGRNLFPNRKFEDIAETVGMDLKINAMGTAVGDIENDGDLDYYFTNIRFNHMMVNPGSGLPFRDESKERGLQYVSISWGAVFADFDHDQDLDLFVANGDLNPNTVPMADYYFENELGRFQEKARAKGLADYGLGRGVVCFDLENDGDMDLLVVNQKPTADYPVSSFTRLYRNDSAQAHWIKIRLIGLRSDTEGLGARLVLYANGTRQTREVDGGNSSHLSQHSPIVHFGLNENEMADSLIVYWPYASSQVFTRLAADTCHILQQEEMYDKNYPWLMIIICSALVILLSYFYLKFR
jgi:enediyne biosynthesis protein E4